MRTSTRRHRKPKMVDGLPRFMQNVLVHSRLHDPCRWFGGLGFGCDQVSQLNEYNSFFSYVVSLLHELPRFIALRLVFSQTSISL